MADQNPTPAPPPAYTEGSHPQAPQPTQEEKDTTEDQECFMRTLRAFREYGTHAMNVANCRRQDFLRLPPEHQQLLGFNPDEKIFTPHAECVQRNQYFLNALCEAAPQLYNSYWPNPPTKPIRDEPPTSLDIDKVFSTLRQVVRDWCDEGAAEREAVFKPIREHLNKLVPNHQIRGGVRILVPGCGLARFMVDLALMGFAVQGNEFSYHMLIGGHFMMNHIEHSKQFVIHPYADSSLNCWKRSDQFRPIDAPAKSAYDLMEEAQRTTGIEFGELSMVAGDFIEVYSKPKEIGAWDIIATIFFVDTAHNIVEYLQVIYNALVPGGQWINFGPLMWHFSTELTEFSIDLSLAEVLQLARNVGFVINDKEIQMIDTTYAGNKLCMKEMMYHCAFFVATKPGPQ